jgi:hypothetical protein
LGSGGGVKRLKSNMKLEDPQLNIQSQTKNVRKAKNIKVDSFPYEPENIETVNTVVANRLSQIDKRLKFFLSEHPVVDTPVLISDFEKLRTWRHKNEIGLAEMIDGFDIENNVNIKKITGGKQQSVENLSFEISGHKDKDNLKNRVMLSSLIRNFFDRELQQVSTGKKMRLENQKSGTDNISNLLSAEIQQYIAIWLIKNPKENYKLFKENIESAKNIYNLPPHINESLEVAVAGLVGAYHYYREKGYKVNIAQPETDASKETDLFVVKWGLLTPDEKNIITEEGVEKVDDFSEEIKNEIFKVQVKCHRNNNEKTREIVYDYKKNKAYDGESNYVEGVDIYSISNYDYRPDEDYLFFKNQCYQRSNGRFLDMKYQDALMYLEKKQEE